MSRVQRAQRSGQIPQWVMVAGVMVMASGCAKKKRAGVMLGYQELIDPGLPVRTIEAQRAAVSKACSVGYRPACAHKDFLGDDGWDVTALGDAAALSCTDKSGLFRDDLSCLVAGSALLVSETPGQGQRLLELGCLGGDDVACLVIEDFRRRGRGIARDPAAAATPIAEACKEGQGDPRACRVQGQMSLVGDGVPRDLEGALVVLRPACDAGDPVACAELGFGLRQSGDHAGALPFLELACQGAVSNACAVVAKEPSPPAYAVAGATRECPPGDVAGCPLGLSTLPPVEAELACEQGDAAACTATGRAMLLGELPWGSFRGGVAVFDNACALGHVPGCTWEARLLDYWAAEPRKLRWLFPYACARGDEDGCIEAARRDLADPDLAVAAADALHLACEAGDANACSAHAEGVLQGRVPGDKRLAVSQLQQSCAEGGRFGCGTLGKAVLERQPDLGSQFLLVGCGNLERGTCETLVNHFGTEGVPPGLGDTGWNALFAQVCEMGEPGVCASWDIARREGRTVPVDLDNALRGLRVACREGHAQACEMADPLSADLNRRRRTFGEKQVAQVGVVSISPPILAEGKEAFDHAIQLSGACVRKAFERKELTPGQVLVQRGRDGSSTVLTRNFPEGPTRACIEGAFAKVPVVENTDLVLFAGWGAPPSLKPPTRSDGITYALRFGPGAPEVEDRSAVNMGDVDDRRLGTALLAAVPFGAITADCPLLGDSAEPQWPSGELLLDLVWHTDGSLGEVTVRDDAVNVPALTACIVEGVQSGGWWLGRPGSTEDIVVTVPLEFRQLIGGPVMVGGVTIDPGG